MFCTVIAIEGPDKVGKKTVSTSLVKTLRETLDLKVYHQEIPFKDNLGLYKKIYEMLDDGYALKFPEMFQSFQVANRMIFREQFDDCNYEVLVLDRWCASGWVYGRVTGLTDLCISYSMKCLVEPDLTMILDGTPFPTSERKDDCYERELQSKVRNGYLQWAKENSEKCAVIDAKQPLDSVLREVLGYTTKTISKLSSKCQRNSSSPFQ